MKNITALSILSLALTSCLGMGGFKPESPDPVVWIDAPQHDFGSIPATETVSHEFTVANKGGAPLNLSRVQTSCGCTAAVLGHQFLKPGESTKLKVTFDPRGRMGTQSRTIWIHSNDPKSPQKQIVISATMPAAAAAAPPMTTTAVSGTLMAPGASGAGAMATWNPSATTASQSTAPAKPAVRQQELPAAPRPAAAPQAPAIVKPVMPIEKPAR
jgi:hypothetical protein